VQEAKQAVDWSAIDFSKSVSRPMKRQRMWSVGVCTKLSAPLMVALAFFGAMYMIGSASTDKISITALTASVTEQRKVRGCLPVSPAFFVQELPVLCGEMPSRVAW
jgi:hypothetical protein